MGENLDVPGRLAMRTPMQWSADANGGFSTLDGGELVRPMMKDGEFGYRKVNATDQRQDSGSLLNWMANLIRARKENPEFGWGTTTIIHADHPSVFAHRCEWDDGGVAIAVHNLSSEPCDVTLDLPKTDIGSLIHFFGDREYEPLRGKVARMKMEGYGYSWLRVGGLR